VPALDPVPPVGMRPHPPPRSATDRRWIAHRTGPSSRANVSGGGLTGG
jgi:hypothetical protein